jgi:predicted transcriptional regulator
MDHDKLMELTADIVSAHVSHNSVDATAVPRLIQSVYDALAKARQPVPVIEEKPQPVVSIRSSVKPDALTCLECGARFKMLKRHIQTDHGLFPADYRARWGLPGDYPMVAAHYAEKRRDLAKKIGLGRKPGAKVQRKAATNRATTPSEESSDTNAEG